MSWAYLLLNAAVISIPLAFSWHSGLRFVDRWKPFWAACVLVLAFFVTWDVPFTAWGVWGFEEEYLLGVSLLGLPVEEWLFFICIPYACVFTYHSLERLDVRFMGDDLAARLNAGVAMLCVVLAVLFFGRLYTTLTAVFTACFAGWMVWRRPFWAPGFWTAFLVLLPAFVVTNGVLTGIRFWEYPVINLRPDSVLSQSVLSQVVWYDNLENMGVRFFSIPLDDFLYAFLLIGLNVALMEGLSRRWSRKA